MFAVGITFARYNYAERVMSATAKFLVHLLREGDGWGEMGEGRGRRIEWGENGEGTEVRETGTHEKIRCTLASHLTCQNCYNIMNPHGFCDLPLLFNSLFHDKTLNLVRVHFESQHQNLKFIAC